MMSGICSKIAVCSKNKLFWRTSCCSKASYFQKGFVLILHVSKWVFLIVCRQIIRSSTLRVWKQAVSKCMQDNWIHDVMVCYKVDYFYSIIYFFEYFLIDLFLWYVEKLNNWPQEALTSGSMTSDSTAVYRFITNRRIFSFFIIF